MFSKFFHRIKGKAVSTEETKVPIDTEVDNDNTVEKTSEKDDIVGTDEVIVEESELEKDEEESNEDVDTELSNEVDQTSVETMEYEIVEREILPEKMVCPDCGGITLEGLEFCDKCGGEL